MIGEGTDSTRPVALDFFDRRRGMGQIPPDLVVKFQTVDIVDVIL
jgi:hypothetical protein